MHLGNKVKLPEWTGYWYIPEDKQRHTANSNEEAFDGIKVFAKNGDIYDTPWIDKYKDRDDFAVTRGDLGFDFAILALNNGKAVRRKSWTTLLFVSMIGIKFNMPWLGGGTRYTSAFAKVGKDLSVDLGWRPSESDMLATDWELAEDTIIAHIK